MATVKIFPTGPTWETWDQYRSQAVTVDFDTLAAATNPDLWVSAAELGQWPGANRTNVESDATGAIGNAVIFDYFDQVLADYQAAGGGTTVAAGIPAPSSSTWILLGLAAVGAFLVFRK